MNITCSATATAFELAVIVRVIFFLFEASVSILSYPTPCLDIILRFFASSISAPGNFAVLIESASHSDIFELMFDASKFSITSKSNLGCSFNKSIPAL